MRFDAYPPPMTEEESFISKSGIVVATYVVRR